MLNSGKKSKMSRNKKLGKKREEKSASGGKVLTRNNQSSGKQDSKAKKKQKVVPNKADAKVGKKTRSADRGVIHFLVYNIFMYILCYVYILCMCMYIIYICKYILYMCKYILHIFCHPTEL